MWIADGWNDYEVLDTSAGEKLERWGDYILVRPDPQVIWNTPHKVREWKQKNGHYHRSNKGGGQWEFFDLPEQWEISYGNLKFHLKPFHFKHTGLFPEQAVNWEWSGNLIREAKKKNPGKEIKVLNLFAYTGGATVACADAGAAVTHVDASKGMVTWAKENAAASGLANAPIRYLVDDCVKFVSVKFAGAIIMMHDYYGPAFLWKRSQRRDLENRRKNFPTGTACTKVLADKPLFFLINSYTTGLQPAVLSYMLNLELKSRFGGTVEADEIGLPVRGKQGLVLPCGASGRWSRKERE